MSYDQAHDDEKERAKGFRLIQEYENYYLMGKYTEDNKLLYRECFSKFDIDGVEKHKMYGRYFKY